MLDISWREIIAGDRCPVHKHCISLCIWNIRKSCILARNHPWTWEQVLHNKNEVPTANENSAPPSPFEYLVNLPCSMKQPWQNSVPRLPLLYRRTFFHLYSKTKHEILFPIQSIETHHCGSHWIYQNRDTQIVPTNCSCQAKLKAIFIA